MTQTLCVAEKLSDFTECTDLVHADAVTRTTKLLDYLAQQGCSQEERVALRQAANLMFHLHAKADVSGVSYVYHTIAVAETLVYRFKIYSTDAVIATFLHDGPEDEAIEINRLTGRGRDNSSTADAIAGLQRMFLRGESLVGEFLKRLTNPDFKLLSEALKRDDGSEDCMLAKKLFADCVYAHDRYITMDPKNFGNPRKVWNGLYLGKLYDLFTSDSLAAAGKAADFTVNALRLSREELSPEEYDQYRKKYGPVAVFLANYLDETRVNPGWLNNSGREFLRGELDRALRDGLYLAQGKEG